MVCRIIVRALAEVTDALVIQPTNLVMIVVVWVVRIQGVHR